MSSGSIIVIVVALLGFFCMNSRFNDLIKSLQEIKTEVLHIKNVMIASRKD